MKAPTEHALEVWQVHPDGLWKNDEGPKGWHAVSNEDGIVAYFANEEDAGRYRWQRALQEPNA